MGDHNGLSRVEAVVTTTKSRKNSKKRANESSNREILQGTVAKRKCPKQSRINESNNASRSTNENVHVDKPHDNTETIDYLINENLQGRPHHDSSITISKK